MRRCSRFLRRCAWYWPRSRWTCASRSMASWRLCARRGTTTSTRGTSSPSSPGGETASRC
ncbi:hypothetical protein D7V97_27240 [Corallococcus sp. CA053C]|nr:hypothetical protein D7V97_27240 [Corallococcus sp. CA053C]